MESRLNDLFCADLPTKPCPEIGPILVAGSTGYIGGRLVPELLARGYKDIRNVIPIETLGYKEAILRALSREDQDRVYTRWSDAYPPAHELAIKLQELEGKLLYTDSYSLLTKKDARSLFSSICRIGGKEGWFHSNWMWRLRGTLDRILMGVGISRGRKNSSSLEIDDVIDFWRVEDYRIDKRLLLRAEMKLPGKAWLEFNIHPEGDWKRLSIKAYFQNHGILGTIYWYLFLPFHFIIFRDLIKEIEKKASMKT